jgi:hypothetical protein
VWQAGLGGEDRAGDAGGGDERRPPGQAAGPPDGLVAVCPVVVAADAEAVAFQVADGDLQGFGAAFSE